MLEFEQSAVFRGTPQVAVFLLTFGSVRQEWKRKHTLYPAEPWQIRIVQDYVAEHDDASVNIHLYFIIEK